MVQNDSEFVIKIKNLAIKLEQKVDEAVKERDHDLDLLSSKMQEQQLIIDSMGKFTEISKEVLNNFLKTLSQQHQKIR